MVGQSAYSWYAYADEDAYLHHATVQIKNRDVMAEVALTRTNDITSGDGIWCEIEIIRMNSASGVEHFDPGRTGIFRHNVTSITVQVAGLNSYSRGLLMVNYWS